MAYTPGHFFTPGVNVCPAMTFEMTCTGTPVPVPATIRSIIRVAGLRGAGVRDWTSM